MMVKNRQVLAEAIVDMGFRSPAGSPSGVEVLPFETLKQRAVEALVGLHRPHFHQLIAPTSGRLRFMVDFVDYSIRPGTWLWVRPGQVQRWGDLTTVDGNLILFEADFLDRETASAARIDDPGGPTVCRPFDGGAALETARAHLAQEFHALGDLPLPVHLATLRHLLAALTLRLAHSGPGEEQAVQMNETFRSFQHAVEHDFARSRRVEDYAATLGYSPRTLSRACVVASGCRAKDFIDRRVVLEAKRLLAHSDHTAAKIARDLGFNDATNFSKYFHHRTGVTPIEFRAAVRHR